MEFPISTSQPWQHCSRPSLKSTCTNRIIIPPQMKPHQPLFPSTSTACCSRLVNLGVFFYPAASQHSASARHTMELVAQHMHNSAFPARIPPAQRMYAGVAGPTISLNWNSSGMADLNAGRLRQSFSCSSSSHFLSIPSRSSLKPVAHFIHDGCPNAGELKMQRRQFVKGNVAAGLVACSSALVDSSLSEETGTGLEELPFKPEGYNFWDWRGHKVHYVVQGEGHPILLIHGFGASVFHWRYNIPDLAKSYKVYAIDLLGFGLSEKALVDYNAFVWRDQVTDFVSQIVGQPCLLVGNSVGGFTALLAAAERPDLTSGLVLVNASGQFESPGTANKEGVVEQTVWQRLIVTPVKTWARKLLIWVAFWQAKQPARIRSVLNNVYVNKSNVDDYLVQSIVQPAQDPNAFEVYYRLMTQVLFKPTELTLDKLLAQLSVPLLLLWGDLDPWMGPTKAEKILQVYPAATLVRLNAGHCPHDEAPEKANQELRKWFASISQGRL